jgi:hypothetical protein
MSDENAIELIKQGDKRFSARQTLDSLRQEIALSFAPHLASWTTTQQLSDDFCSHLADGTPLLLARDYVGQIGAMLRPPGKQWFWHRTPHDDLNNTPNVRRYLDARSSLMNRIVFDRMTGAEGALQQTDEFYGLFGDAVLSVDLSDKLSSLRIQSHHTKDCAWSIGKENKADVLTRKEMMQYRVVKARFSRPGDKLHPKLLEKCEKEGDQECEIRHEVRPASEYDAYIKKSPMKHKDGFVSVWVDVANKAIIRETYTPTFRYVIPRAGRRHGFAYGFSRATMAALPDARMLQQQAVAIIEAAEKQISPPLVAYTDAIRGDVRLDGITWIDGKYDERSGDPLRTLELGKNFQLGVEALLRTESQLTRAFYLDRLRMPDTRSSKSTMEVGFLIDEYIRSAVPLFSPMKVEYSDEFLFEVDTLIDLMGGYGDMEKPQELKEVELVFAWDNPLTDMLERQKAQKASELAILAQSWAGLEVAAAQSPALQQVDTSKGFRESAMSIGVASWLVDERTAKKKGEELAQANQAREAVAAAPDIANVIHRGAQAAQIAGDIPNPAEPGMPLLPAAA